MRNADYRRVTKVKKFGNGVGGVELECSNEEARERLYQLEDAIDDNMLRFMPYRVGEEVYVINPIACNICVRKVVRIEVLEFDMLLVLDNGQRYTPDSLCRRAYSTVDEALTRLQEVIKNANK